MSRIRIVKEYKSWSPKAGIIEADSVTIGGGADACARFVTAANASDALDYRIIDYEVPLISKMSAPEILENRTGGRKGKIKV